MKEKSEKVQKWRTKTKQSLIECLGGKCNRCGYKECYAALDFHHLNSKDKSFTIANALARPKNINAILDEVKKCILLCGNCHSELHVNHWRLDEIVIFQLNMDKYNEYIESLLLECICGKKFRSSFDNRKYCSNQCIYLKKGKKYISKTDRICSICNNNFIGKTNSQEFCSYTCSNLGRRKVKRPLKEELEKLIWEKPTTTIAKEFGVSDQAVAKWCRLYNIKKPPRGYWSKLKK